MADSGCVVATNNFLNKPQEYCNGISASILSRDVELETIARTAAQTENQEVRCQNAVAMRCPKTWQETRTPRNEKLGCLGI